MRATLLAANERRNYAAGVRGPVHYRGLDSHAKDALHRWHVPQQRHNWRLPAPSATQEAGWWRPAPRTRTRTAFGCHLPGKRLSQKCQALLGNPAKPENKGDGRMKISQVVASDSGKLLWSHG